MRVVSVFLLMHGARERNDAPSAFAWSENGGDVSETLLESETQREMDVGGC